MKFRAWICAIQSPQPKNDGPAAVKVVLETYRENMDVNELLDLRGGGAVAVEFLAQTEQQKLAIAAEKKAV